MVLQVLEFQGAQNAGEVGARDDVAAEPLQLSVHFSRISAGRPEENDTLTIDGLVAALRRD